MQTTLWREGMSASEVEPRAAVNGDDGVDATVVRWIELLDRASIQIAGRRQIVAPLIFLDGRDQIVFIDCAVGGSDHGSR